MAKLADAAGLKPAIGGSRCVGASPTVAMHGTSSMEEQRISKPLVAGSSPASRIAGCSVCCRSERMHFLLLRRLPGTNMTRQHGRTC